MMQFTGFLYMYQVCLTVISKKGMDCIIAIMGSLGTCSYAWIRRVFLLFAVHFQLKHTRFNKGNFCKMS